MKKIFSFLLLGLFLSIGNVWGEATKRLTLDFTNQSNWNIPTSGTNNSRASFTDGNTTIYLYSTTNYKLNNGYLILGKANSYLELPAFSFNVTKIVVVGRDGASGSTVQNVFVGNVAVSTATTGVTGTNEYVINPAYRDPGIIYQLQVTSNHNSQITTMEIWGEDVVANKVSVPTFSVVEGVYTSAQSVSISCATDGATIYYTTDGTEPTTNSNVYSSAISISSTTTLKAFAVKAGMTDSDIQSANYIIAIIEHAGTQVDPYSVADARYAIDLETGMTGVYAKGVVSAIPTVYNPSFSNVTFNMVDEAGNQEFLQAYRCGGADAENVQIGDTVVVTGNLTKYGVTYEFGQGCQIVSLIHPVVITPSIDLSSSSIEAPAAGIEDGEITVTYNNITTVVAELVFCNAQGIAVQEGYDWVLAGLNEGNNIVYTIAANDGAARTAYMKVSALTDNSDIIYSDLITISQAEYVAPGHGDTPEDPFTVTEVLSGAATGNDVYVEGYIVGFVTGTASFTPEISSGNNSNWAFAASADETDFANVIPVQITSANQAQYGLGKHPYLVGAKMIVKGDIMTYFSKSGVKNTDEFTLVSATLTLGTNGYSTFAADFNFTVSGAQAYKAKYQNGVIVLTEVNTVAAGEGIILKGTEGATVSIVPAEVADDFADNELVGVLEPVYAEGSYYVLATLDNDGITKFHPCPGVEIPANKAFIIIDDVNNAPVRIVFAENGATNIEQLDGSEKAVKFFENGNLFFLRNGVVYDATGRVVR
jgi:hypothetical protein